MAECSSHAFDLDSLDANIALQQGDTTTLARYFLETSGSLRTIADFVRAVQCRAPSPGSDTSQGLSHSIKPDRAPPEHNVQEGVNSRAHFASDEATQRQPSEAVGETVDWTATGSQLQEAIKRPAP